ncbi:winged helix-turn-helix domain-containing protein [Elusimicrobiota bacterium]
MKLNLKNQLRVLFWMLFIVPLLDILIFNATTSLFSAALILISLVLFFLMAIFNIDGIEKSLKEFQKKAIEESNHYRKVLDITASDITAKMRSIDKKIKHVETADNASRSNIDSVSSDINEILNSIDEIMELSEADLTINRTSREVKIFEELVELTPIEFELLWIFIEKKGKVLTRDYLLKRVWGFEMAISTRSVDMAITRLRKKITSSKISIITVTGFGYKISS